MQPAAVLARRAAQMQDRSSVATAAPIRKEQPVVVDVVTGVTGAGVQSVGVA
jgi:hypothetical protein